MKRLALLVLLLGACVDPVRAQRPDDVEAVIRRLDTQLAADVARDSVGSISVALVEDGRVIWAKAYGWAERDRRIPADTSHLYRIGSITKSFTAVVLMQLVERGVIGLDDPVARALPPIGGLADRPAGGADLTYRHLASHTSGLIREPRLPGAAAGPIAGWEDKILASIPTTAYATAPGERYSYSNIGFGMLGLAVSRAAATPFMDLVREGILSPLGMESSTFIVDEPLRARLATGYAQRRDGVVDAEQPEHEHAGRGYKVPNGGLYSTAGDLARFIGGMTGAAPSPILKDASRQEMFRLQTPEEPGSGYGLGFTIQIDSLGRRFVGHGGSVSGYTAYLLFEPGSGLGVVLLRNYDRGATNLARVARSVLDGMLEAGAGVVRRPDRSTTSGGGSGSASERLSGGARRAARHFDEAGEVALEHHGPVPRAENQHRGRRLAAHDLVALLQTEVAAEISQYAEQDGADADVLVRLDLGETARLLVRGEADHGTPAGRASRWCVPISAHDS